VSRLTRSFDPIQILRKVSKRAVKSRAWRRGGCAMTKSFAGLAFVALLSVAAGTQAASLSSSTYTSTDGNFTLTWTSGYELRAAPLNPGGQTVRWRYAAPPTTSLAFSGLPSGAYSYELWSCVGSTCTEDATTKKTVTVTRDIEPALDTTTSAAGTTAYTATVTNRGASHISVPLKVLPGRYDSGPELSLEYDSARGSDIAYVDWVDDTIGYGWQLKGLSRIHRCRAGLPSSPEPQLDTDVGGSGDRLCLDGMGLVVVSGTNRQPGAVYRTSVISNIKITQLQGGTAPNTYDYFNVEYPNGGVAQFGGTTPTRPASFASVLTSPQVSVLAVAPILGLECLTRCGGDTEFRIGIVQIRVPFRFRSFSDNPSRHGEEL
jgi:hypothetical protein